MDMNRILVTGDELYTFLQRSSSINNRYLLVEELPQYFECFNGSYTFQPNESITTVILADVGFNLADFNALPLKEALHLALTDTDGCFVCFGGNTMLIGRMTSGFFTFDSHSRSSDGLCNVNGNSSRLLFQNIDQVYAHLERLAHSMGFSKGVECNLTSVSCKLNSLRNVCGLVVEKDISNISRTTDLPVKTSIEECDENDDLVFIRHEQSNFDFIPLSPESKENICHDLNIPYITTTDANEMSSRMNLTKPMIEKKIAGDGNCFFRAISFSLTNSEDFHGIIRNAVCVHMMENEELFNPFLNDGVQTVQSHLSSTEMSKLGTWATEVEIFATAHLLNIDIYTYSRGCWLKFAADDVQFFTETRSGAVYLNHHHQNHYNVILSVGGQELEGECIRKCKHSNEYERRFRNRTRMQRKRLSSRQMQNSLSPERKKKQQLGSKYLNNETYQAETRLRSKQRYHDDIEYQTRTKERNKKVYTSDQGRRESLKMNNIEKYRNDEQHRNNLKKKKY